MNLTITLRTESHKEILVNLVCQEIEHLAGIREEFRAKDIDCGGVITQIERLQTILRDLTYDK